MYPTEIESRLAELSSLLNELKEMPESEVCLIYNVDYKKEIIDVLQEELDTLENEYTVYDYTDQELEEERMALCSTQALLRYC